MVFGIFGLIKQHGIFFRCIECVIMIQQATCISYLADYRSKSLKHDGIRPQSRDIPVFLIKCQIWTLSHRFPPMAIVFLDSTPKNHPETVEKFSIHQKVNIIHSDPRLFISPQLCCIAALFSLNLFVCLVHLDFDSLCCRPFS